MMLAHDKITMSSNDNVTPLHHQLLNQFNALDEKTRRDMIRVAAVAAQARLNSMLALARRVS